MFNRVHGLGSFPDGIGQSESSHSTPGAELPLELQELLQEQATCRSAAAEAASSDWPVSIYVPERYEENYAYPLLVWFHDAGQHEGQVEPVMSAISSQNYCGLGVQGNQSVQDGVSFDWNPDLLEYGSVSLEDLLSVTIRRLRQAFHIHSERIFVAGAGAGADVALQQLAQTPDWYAGAVLFNPTCGTPLIDSLSVSNLSSKPLLWTVSRTASSEHLAHNVEAVQLSRLAGAEPEVRVTDSALDPESSDIRFVDHWLLSKFGSEACV